MNENLIPEIILCSEFVVKIYSNSGIEMIPDIIIPLLSSIIGGLIALYASLKTTKLSNIRAQREYIEKIKPFFIIEQIEAIDACKGKIKEVCFEDDSCNDPEGTQSVFKWDSLLLSNVGDDICTFDYIKINESKYKFYEDIPIKSGELCMVNGSPSALYIADSIVCISIGIRDKRQNLYEYTVDFQIEKCTNQQHNSYQNSDIKMIRFLRINCNSPMIEE